MLRVASRRQHSQQGSSLIEVLVAVLIIALGVVALAGLLMSSGRLAKANEYRALGGLLVEDIASRMRATITTTATPAGAAAIAANYTLAPAVLTAAAPAANTACEGTAATCTPANMAAYDLAAWQRAVFAALPSGTGTIAVDATAAAAGSTVINVWIAWLDPQATSTTDFDTADNTVGNCPAALAASKPRCMFFRVGL